MKRKAPGDPPNAQDPDIPWTLFDKNLVGVVLAAHNLPEEMSKYLAEETASTLKEVYHDLLGLHPPAHSLLRKTNETILALARMGNVVLVGRGSAFLTRRLRGGFHVRVVVSSKKRVEGRPSRFRRG